MGAYQSVSQDYERALQYFNDSEQNQMRDIFKKICHGGKWLSKEQLHDHCCKLFPEHMSFALHAYMKLTESQSLQQNVSAAYEGFVICMAHALKGSPDEKALLLGCLACCKIEQEPNFLQIKQVIEVFWNAFQEILKTVPNYSTWCLQSDQSRDTVRPVIRTFMHDLISDGKQLQSEMSSLPPEDTVYGHEVLQSWLQKSALLLRMIDIVFHHCFPIGFQFDQEHQASPQFPLCVNADWTKVKTLLDPAAMVYLNFHLPHELRTEWRLLFCSKTHGESYSTLCRRITDQGPSLLILRDTKGHVFGGFASQSWRFGSNFVGSQSCFLFRLKPQLEVYPSTGYNDHFMYFNHGQETLPNGLGMGGQFGYFGLFLDEEFTHGHSKAEPRCTTFISPQLSADSLFQLETLEVWAVGPEIKPTSDDEEEKAGSILDKDPEAKAMLSLIDKGPHSEGLRDRDPMADMPEEHSLPAGLG